MRVESGGWVKPVVVLEEEVEVEMRDGEGEYAGYGAGRTVGEDNAVDVVCCSAGQEGD